MTGKSTPGDDRWQINLICCDAVMCNEIKQGVALKDVALTFAMTLKSEAQGADKPDWNKIADAAIARWGVKGWRRLKERGWAIAEGRVKP